MIIICRELGEQCPGADCRFAFSHYPNPDVVSEYLFETTAILNAAIRVIRNLDPHHTSILFWTERVLRNMALLSCGSDPENRSNRNS
jgi:hypothetical protein